MRVSKAMDIAAASRAKGSDMTILTVGPTSTYPTIAAAMAVAAPGDMIVLSGGYGNETAIVTQQDLTIEGDASSAGINLQLAKWRHRRELAGHGTDPCHG